ncbi:MAG: hypothetical protein AB7D28_00950 [Candidatus Berkiella sp.]
MKYYVVGSAISFVDGEQPTKDALLTSLEVLKKEKTVLAFENIGLAQNYLKDKFGAADKDIHPIFEIEGPAKQKIHKLKLDDGRVITGREIAIAKVNVLNALLNLSNKALNNVEINEALSDVKAPVAKVEKTVAQTEEPVAQTEEPAAQTEEPAVQTEEPAAQTEEPVAQTEESVAQKDEAKPSAIRSLFTKVKNAFFSMYVQIPLIGFGFATQGGTALILEQLAQLGVTTAYPLVLEAGIALAFGAAFYGMGQAIVWGISSAYNAISKKLEKTSEKTAADQETSAELTTKLAATLDTSKGAANEATNEVEDLISTSPTVVRMSSRSSSVESSPKSSSSSSKDSSNSAESSVSSDEEVSTKKTSMRAKSK